jgi:hypothetical protein
MSETVAAAAPASPVSATPVADAAPAAPVAAPDVGAPADGSADPAPAPAPSPLEQTLLDAPAAEPEKPAEPPAPVDPASYEIKLPEGMTREDPMIASFLESAAGRRLDGETVQAVIDSVAPKIAEQLTAPYKAWSELNATWQAEIKADPVVGGANLPASVAAINGAIDRFGTPELKDALRTTGAANNPHVFRFLHKLASAYAEATPVTAGNSGHVAPPPGRAALDRMYPSSARQANGAA